MRTLRSLDAAGLDLRLWCYACERAAVVDGIIWMLFEERGWPMEIEAARPRFRCTGCNSRADVLIVVTKRPVRERAGDAAQLVASFFHTMRSASKQRKYKAQGKI
jgi:hypothetical protein